MDTATPTPEEQAAQDAALMATLSKQRAGKKVQQAFTINHENVDHIDESGVPVDKDGFPLTLTEVPDIEPITRQPMNRAERRAQVKQYAAILTLTERQHPVVNPTIRPKSKKGRRRAH